MTNISPIFFNIPEAGGFLVQIITKLISITSSIALGIVLFTLLLKLITLPFDLFSKVSMRKNSLKMEAMRPDLEKLQKQYANDKVLYNQKMMALYKKNGYSMWGSCLPTILTLVIFIVAINAFSDYSRLQNQQHFYQMSLSYNSVIYEGLDADGEIFSYDEESKTFSVDHAKVKQYLESDVSPQNVKIEKVDGTNDTYHIYSENGYVIYQCSYLEANGVFTFNGNSHVKYLIDGAKVKANSSFSETFNAVKAEFSEDEKENDDDNTIGYEVIIREARERSAEKFNEVNAGFFWVKNIWMPDSSFEHPIYSDVNKFVASFGYDQTKNKLFQADYDELTYNLSSEKDQANGYFILVVLTAVITWLSQVVIGKSQKAQMELQTVDGQGAQTQKMMKWMMPLMMGFFAFMYTAAFSIYIVLSSAFGMGITLLINLFVDKKYKSIEDARAPEKVRGRIYTPKPEEKKPEQKKDKKKEVPANDFLSGLADNKKGRRH